MPTSGRICGYMMLKKISVYSVLLVYFLNLSSIYVRLVFSGAAVVTSAVSMSVFAEPIKSDTPRLDELKEKYDLDNPNRNHSNNDLRNDIKEQMNRPGRNMNDVINHQINTASPSRTVDLTGQSSGKTQAQMASESNAFGKSIGTRLGQPALNNSGGVESEYSKQGTREFYRDSDGKLKIRTKDGGGRVSDVGSADLYSAEKDNTQYDFKADTMYGDDEAIRKDGLKNHNSLKSGSTGAARGYQVIAGSSQQVLNTGINENDAWLQPGFNAVNKAQNENGEFFKSCSNVTIKKNQDLNYTTTTEHTCSDNKNANLQSCQIERTYVSAYVASGHSNATVTSCGPNCAEITIGKNADNTWASNCGIFSSSVVLDLHPDIILNSITNFQGVIDDHAVFKINGETAWSFINGVPGSSGELASVTNCDMETNYTVTHQGNILNALKTEQAKRAPILLKLDVKVGDVGEGQIKFRLNYTAPDGYGVKLKQFPEGCFDSVRKAERDSKPLNGYSNNSESTSTAFCSFDSYKTVVDGSGGLPPNLLSTIPDFFSGDTGNKTWRVNLEGYGCDPTGGKIMCRANPETGQEECVNWKDVQKAPNQCQIYLDNTQCREVARVCPDGWVDEQTGQCLIEDVTFRCDKPNETELEFEETTNVCDAAIPCADGNCVDDTTEGNTKFIDAMVAGSIMDGMQNDATCSDPADPSTCRVFDGEYKYCSWEVTGLGTDCCEQPKGISILSYIAMARQMMKVTQMAGTGAFGTTAQGTYNTLAEPITSAADAISGWANTAYKSATESLMGNSTGKIANTTVSAGASKSAIGAAIAELQQKVYGYVYDMMPESLAKLIFTESATAGGASQLALSEGLTNGFSNVMAVYTAYQMVKLALTLLTSCDDIEVDMGVKLAQRSCFKVGGSYCSKKFLGICYQKRQNYCCYSSILSRIIMKESYAQLGINPVNDSLPREESCRGLNLEQIGQVDFAAPSMTSALQEWVGLLAASGEIPNKTSEQSLTGDAQSETTSCSEVEEVVTNPVTGEVMKNSDGSVQYRKTGKTECWKKNTAGQIWNPGNRDTASQRTKDMTKTADDRVQESKDRMKDATNELDCSETPEIPICKFAFDPRSLDD